MKTDLWRICGEIFNASGGGEVTFYVRTDHERAPDLNALLPRASEPYTWGRVHEMERVDKAYDEEHDQTTKPHNPRRPWVVLIWTQVPGPGAAGNRVTSGALVFGSEEAFRNWSVSFAPPSGWRITRRIYGDHRRYGPDEESAPDTVEYIE